MKYSASLKPYLLYCGFILCVAGGALLLIWTFFTRQWITGITGAIVGLLVPALLVGSNFPKEVPKAITALTVLILYLCTAFVFGGLAISLCAIAQLLWVNPACGVVDPLATLKSFLVIFGLSFLFFAFWMIFKDTKLWKDASKYKYF